MKYSELEDSSELATQEWVEYKLKDLKIQQRTEQLKRQGQWMSYAGLIAFGMIWGFLIAEILFLRK